MGRKEESFVKPFLFFQFYVDTGDPAQAVKLVPIHAESSHWPNVVLRAHKEVLNKRKDVEIRWLSKIQN